MPTYAIGDVQGCFRELQDLLDCINFDQTNDRLWFTGDLVNRGPDSLATLRFVKNLNAINVLGNHDLHLLAVSEGIDKHSGKDTLEDVLHAKDRDELLHWLRHLPLLHFDSQLGFMMVHAGLPPQWDLQKATTLTGEVEQVLRSKHYRKLLDNMYGNQPDRWDDRLTGMERLRFIINALTRSRYYSVDGIIDLVHKGSPGNQTHDLFPWFSLDSRKTRKQKILFGHWASIHAGNLHDFEQFNVYPLDTGCVWGGRLTALRLEDGEYFYVPSRQPKIEE
jgi:bis(5'-nucleosyl)-tetraphosphatase (symmetrical)